MMNKTKCFRWGRAVRARIALLIPYVFMCTCLCVCVYACVRETKFDDDHTSYSTKGGKIFPFKKYTRHEKGSHQYLSTHEGIKVYLESIFEGPHNLTNERDQKRSFLF